MAIIDTIKNSIMQGFNTSTLTTADIIVTLGFSVLLGAFVYIVYRFTSGKDFYNRNFNKALALLPLITSGIMLAMQNNLLLSLGMVGALSIVRFRNAIKDTTDLTFLFWSISIGIIIGARLFELAIITSLSIAIFILLIDLMPMIKSPYLIVISANGTGCYSNIIDCVKKHSRRYRVCSKNVSSKGMELIVEMKLKDDLELSEAISLIDGVISVSILTHNGESRF